MDSLLKTLVNQYLADILIIKNETVSQNLIRVKRIQKNYKDIYLEIVNSIDSLQILNQDGGRITNEFPLGIKNEINRTFTTKFSFKVGSTKVFLRGIRMTIGIDNDYIESLNNEIIFHSSIVVYPDSNLIIDYELLQNIV